MENGFFQTAEKLNNEHRRTRRWHKVITVMAAIVVFCTTYALILPAITWERSLLCDMKEHTHTASCYAETVITPEKRELVCTTAEHTHGDSCYEEVTTYVCGLEEDETHQHTADCMQTERVLTCEQSEHTHSDDCYHITPAVTEKQLVCAKPEHVHTDACFDAPPSSDSGYYCGCVAHTHNKNCYFEDGTLRCTMKEHTHTLSCQINKSADVETANEWERTFADVKLSGIMREDVLAIAKTQLGYTESTKNFVIDDEKTGDVRGYTRYGAWYGDPYGDWCAMFCAFCMDHAGVKDFPLESNCQTWIEALDQIKMYHKVGTYDPKPGDLVFYCWDEPEEGKERGGDHVGFVYEIVDAVEATETTAAKPAYLRTIEGNWGDCVATVERELNSPDIIGYGEMPKAFTSTFNDDDFTVVAKYDADAKIPADAQLKAEKIPADSELYQQYYQQSVEAMLRNTPATSEEELAISYLQFYDIGFYVNGKEIEPEGPVDIMITTKDEVRIEDDEVASAIHFGESGTEVLNVDTDVPEAQDAESAFSFTQESFSVTGVIVSNRKYNAVDSVSNGDQVVVATWQDIPKAYYLTNRSNGSRLQLSLDPNTTIWTVRVNNGTKYLMSGNQYLTVSSGQSGLTSNQWNAAQLTYNSEGYWDISYNGQHLNEFWGHYGYSDSPDCDNTAQGYTDSAASNQDSRWVILKQASSTPVPAAPASGNITGVQTDTLEVGEWYIIYGGNNGHALNANNISKPEQLKTYPTNGGTVEYNGNQDVVWQWTGEGFRNRNGQYLCMSIDDRIWHANYLGQYWLGANLPSKTIYDSTYHIIYTQEIFTTLTGNASPQYNKLYIHAWDYEVQVGTESFVGNLDPSKYEAEPIYLAKVTGNSSTASGNSNHPRTSTTGTPDMSELVLYNFDATQNDVQGLKGVEYTLYDADGKAIGVYQTTDDFALPIGKLTPGATYTIKQTAVPEGYVVVSQDKQFTVSSAGTAVIGAFYDYKSDDYAPDKTASVVDYEKRTYQVDLKVKQSLYDYVVNNSNFSLVVDQSNSMLFPAQLTETGKTVRLSKNGGNNTRLNQQNLDKNQVYYIITDDYDDTHNTATVYAIFYDGSGWVCQDASYYAKAQNVADGETLNVENSGRIVRYAVSTAKFNTGYNAQSSDGVYDKCNGGSIDGLDGDKTAKIYKDLENSDRNYMLYTGSQYNRLHDLQQAVTMLCNTLSSMNAKATIRLETFDKYVESCESFTLGDNGSGVTDVIKAINNIKCGGGTRQDYALDHLRGVVSVSGSDKTDHAYTNHLNTGKNEYVVLITDGAPNSGVSNDNPSTSKVLAAANKVKSANGGKVKLITAGLSVQNVKGGGDMLRQAATDSSWNYAAENAGDLSKYMTQMLFRAASKTTHNYQAKVVDEISDSFYPINPANNQALTDGTTIGLDGKVITLPSRNQPPYGTVRYNSTTNTWYVEWNDQALNYGNEWTGRIYLKAKEDFIGGNSIDTNKSANISLLQGNKTVASTDLETPTVNVKLLNFNEVNSEETVFLGDKVSIPEKIQALYDQLKFTKLVDNGDKVHNKSDASSTPGLENLTFTPAYAWAKDLDEADWKKLFNGETLTLPYTYDDASSHGPVGYFTVQLTKTGDGSNFDKHATSETGEGVETYTLQIVYTPYKIGEGDGESVRKPNVHNGTRGPGDEVTEPETSTNIHKVNVVDGKITIIKDLTNKLKSTSAQTFTFKLQRQENGEFVEYGEPITVTVNANSTEGSVVIPDLPRGTYRVEEVIGENAEFYMKEMNVVTGAGDTNCHQESSSDTACTFTIGEDTAGNDLIQYVTTPTGYKAVYSYLREGYTGIKGVSYETLKVLNDKVTYTADIPVVKNWDPAIGNDYRDLDVYVALYQNGEPVLDENGNVWALRLNKSNNWHDVFTVPLASKNEDVSKLGYTIRELSGVTSAASDRLSPAIVMNAATESIVYYEVAYTEGMVKIGDSFFGVSTEAGTERDDSGKLVYTLTAYNSKTYALPETGGSGLLPIYTLGALLIAGAWMCGYFLRRKAERRHG